MRWSKSTPGIAGRSASTPHLPSHRQSRQDTARRGPGRLAYGVVASVTAVLAVASGVGAAPGSTASKTAGNTSGNTSAPETGQPNPKLDWAPCEKDATAQCATLTLPIDWDRPAGPTFGLALSRRKATDPAHRIGSLVFGPGGPGDSGVDRVIANDRFSDEMKRRFDIVGIDPRGVGRSNPVLCSRELVAAQPSPIMTSQADFDATVAYNRRLAADCRARTGPMYDHADTRSAARDLDAVREALGEQQLTFHGSSYGTLLGEQYAELFPHRVRAMVLESVVDHSVDTRGFLSSQASTAQDSFDQFVAWCQRTSTCALHGRDVRALWHSLLARAERGELTDPSGATIAPFMLTVLAQKAFYGPDWDELARTLVALDATPPAASSAPTSASPSPETQAPAEAQADTAVPNPFTAIYCADWGLPVRDYRQYAGHLQMVRRIAPDMPYARQLLALSTCLGAPEPVNPQHRLKVRGSQPILLINAQHDPASGYDWAQSVARQLGRQGMLLTYDGSGHGSYQRGECMTSQVDRYLTTLTLPARNTHCPAVDE